MIHLNRINGQPIVVNADLIEMLEVTPEVVADAPDTTTAKTQTEDPTKLDDSGEKG